MRSTRTIVTTAAVLALSACSTTPPPPPPAPPMPSVSTAKMAEANLSPASASIVSGRLALVPDPRGGVHITGVMWRDEDVAEWQKRLRPCFNEVLFDILFCPTIVVVGQQCAYLL